VSHVVKSRVDREPGSRGTTSLTGRLMRRMSCLRWVMLPLLFSSASCLPEPPPPSDPELREELGIPDEVPIHRIDLSGRGDLMRVVPPVTHAAPGDVVQFVVLDHRVHLVQFREERMSGELVEFLRSTGQDRIPPLMERETRLVLTFEDAPVGVYHFQVEGNGPPVDGEIRLSLP
jgi:plastocyanin